MLLLKKNKLLKKKYKRCSSSLAIREMELKPHDIIIQPVRMAKIKLSKLLRMQRDWKSHTLLADIYSNAK